MYSVVLFDSPAGRLVLQDGEQLIAEGDHWEPAVVLLELARRDPLVAGALEAQQDLDRSELSVVAAGEGPDLCLVRIPGRALQVPRAALREAWGKMQRHRERQARLAEVGAWLAAFPVAELPDLSQLDALEAQIAALDPADLVARKRLMLELHAQGLLDDTRREEKRAKLSSRPRLAAWFNAACQACAYLRSSARRQHLGEPVPLLASGVSLEWFLRGPYTAPAVAPDEYLAWREAELLTSDEVLQPTPATSIPHEREDALVYSSDNGRTRCLVGTDRSQVPAPPPGGADVSRGTSSEERLFGPEFWIVGLGCAVLLVLVYLWVRY
jgi:hypothetical protein